MMFRQSARLRSRVSEMGNHVNRPSICLLLTTLLLSTLPAARAAAPSGNSSANQSWYDIELIVFRYTDPQAGDLESWPADPGTPDWNAATALQPQATPAGNGAATGPTAFAQIDAHQLDADWSRLKNSHDYQPLLHVAWMEPLTDHSTAAPVRIGVPPPAPTATSTPGLAIQPPVTPVQAVAPPPAPVPTPVYGSVKFSQYGPYLHFDVDMVCQGPIAAHIMQVPVTSSMTVPASASVTMPAAAVPLAGATTTDYQWYRMTEDRRIEAGKLNYFDNPMFGVLVLVTPHPAATTATH